MTRQHTLALQCGLAQLPQVNPNNHNPRTTTADAQNIHIIALATDRLRHEWCHTPQGDGSTVCAVCVRAPPKNQVSSPCQNYQNKPPTSGNSGAHAHGGASKVSAVCVAKQ